MDRSHQADHTEGPPQAQRRSDAAHCGVRVGVGPPVGTRDPKLDVTDPRRRTNPLHSDAGGFGTVLHSRELW